MSGDNPVPLNGSSLRSRTRARIVSRMTLAPCPATTASDASRRSTDDSSGSGQHGEHNTTAQSGRRLPPWSQPAGPALSSGN